MHPSRSIGILLILFSALIFGTPAYSKPKDKSGKSQAEKIERIQKAAQNVTIHFQAPTATLAAHCSELLDAVIASPENANSFPIMQLALCSNILDQNGENEKALSATTLIPIDRLSNKLKNPVLFQRAISLIKMKKFQEARETYTLCNTDDDESKSTILSNIAETWLSEGDLDKAIQYYLAAREHNPYNPYATFGLSAAYTRAEKWAPAQSSYILGVLADPAIQYFQSSFFIPDYETDYQKANHAFAGKRFKEAEFYLQRYLSRETNDEYSAHARLFLEKIQSDAQNYPVKSYPVLLKSTHALALDESGRYAAIAGIAKYDLDALFSIWIIDLQTERVYQRARILENPKIDFELGNYILENIVDMKFVQNSSVLRIITQARRYELDILRENEGYYIYDNPDYIHNHIDALSADGTQVISHDTDIDGSSESNFQKIHIWPWTDPSHRELLKAQPALPLSGFDYGVLANRDHSQILIWSDHSAVLENTSAEPSDPAELPVFKLPPITRRIALTDSGYAIGYGHGILFFDPKGSPKDYLGTKDLISCVASNRQHIAFISGNSLEIHPVPEI